MTEQTAETTTTGAPAGGADLKTLLAEWPTETASSAAPAKTGSETAPELKPEELATEVAALKRKTEEQDRARQADLAKQVDRDVKDWLSKIKDATPELKPIKERTLRALIDAEVAENPALVTAFVNREAKPEQWAKVEAKLVEKLAGEFSDLPVDRTQDRLAVRAAISGTSSQPPPKSEPDVANLSYRDLMKVASGRAI